MTAVTVNEAFVALPVKIKLGLPVRADDDASRQMPNDIGNTSSVYRSLREHRGLVR